ncbi:MAG TPA: PAS domain S-box protein, partial [Pyrinomonadaceae bacterium]
MGLEAMSKGVQKGARGVALGQRLWWLITGRLVIAVVLWLLAGAQWSREQLGTTGRGSLMIFLVVVLLSPGYAAMLRMLGRLRLQASLQLLMDVLLVTWLVWVTGDLHSPYAALYIIIISVASIFLGPRGALITAVGCALAFTLITIAITIGAVAPYTRSLTAATTLDAVQAIGLNDIAFLVVGLLAAKLAERQSRSDVQLIETTQTLANLRALHERIVESIRSGVVTTDLRGRIYTFNAAAEEITGYRAADIRGQEASILFGELSERIERSMRAAAAGDTSPRFEADCLTPEGLIRRLGYSIFPLSTEAGEQTGLVITFQDLTEVRALEETSRRQDRLAAVGRVAASI